MQVLHVTLAIDYKIKLLQSIHKKYKPHSMFKMQSSFRTSSIWQLHFPFQQSSESFQFEWRFLRALGRSLTLVGHYKDTVRKHLPDLINYRKNTIMKCQCFNKSDKRASDNNL